MRLFIAIKIPQQLHKYCAQLQSKLSNMKNVHDFHITIQFLGNDINKKMSNQIVETLKEIKFKPFDVQMGNALVFPNQFNPKGVWIKCKKTDNLMKFAHKIQNEMKKLGLIADFSFKPQITLGRYKKAPPKPPDTLRGEPHFFTVNEFYLLESKLISSGSSYKTIANFTTIK